MESTRISRRNVLLLALAASGCGLVDAEDSVLKAPARRPANVGFTVVADPRRPKDFVKDLAALKATGSTWIRMGIQFWDVGGFYGRWYWLKDGERFVTDCVRKAHAAGFKICFVLPQMVNHSSWDLDRYIAINRRYWRRVAKTVAAGGGVDVWQVYNEHDGRHFRTQRDLNGVLRPEYLRQLAAAIQACREEVHRIMPRVPVTTNVSGTTVDDGTEAWWRSFYDVIESSVDIIGVNCYPGDWVEQINNIPRRLGRMRDRYSKPVIVTEIGVPTHKNGLSVRTANRVLPLMIRKAAEADPVAVCVYQLRNSGPSATDAEENFGIYDRDHKPRGPHRAVVSAVRSMTNRGRLRVVG